jgi:hypothetical protein
MLFNSDERFFFFLVFCEKNCLGNKYISSNHNQKASLIYHKIKFNFVHCLQVKLRITLELEQEREKLNIKWNMMMLNTI